TLGEDLHQRRSARHHAGVLHRLDVDLAVEALAEVAEVHREGLATKRVLEAALGQAALHRHLPAFETDAGAVVAGPGRVALPALAGGLAMARAHAAADALPLPVRAGVVLEIAERRSHFLLSKFRSLAAASGLQFARLRLAPLQGRVLSPAMPSLAH